MGTKQINLRLSDDLLTLIDAERGLMPRNVFIVDVLSQVVTPEDPPGKVERSPGPISEPGKRANGHRDTCGCLSCERLLGKIE